MAPQRSPLQRAQAVENLMRIRARKHQNQPTESPNPLANGHRHEHGQANKENQQLKERIKEERERGNAFQRKLWNKTREAKRAKQSRDILKRENNRIEQSLRQRNARAPLQKKRLVEKMTKNIYTLPGEAEEKTCNVIKTVAKGLGLQVVDTVSARTDSPLAPMEQLFGIETENKFTTRFLGIGTAPNHTSNMQLHGLQKQVEMIYNVYNKSPLGENAPADAIAFPTYMLGLGSDHAEDQKRLSKLLQSFSMQAKQLCLQFGEESWNKLSEEDRQQAQLFVWCGCSMHKEMNSVKGGAKAMARYWQDLNIQGPVKLMNRDNAAAVAMGSSLAADRANEVSEGGAVKLTSLANFF